MVSLNQSAIVSHPELALFRAAAPPAPAAITDVEKLIARLRGRSWITARTIKGETGWDERTIRQIASESAGQIVSGQKGYKLTLECTPEEERHARQWLTSQARVMTQRAIDISKVFHGAA